MARALRRANRRVSSSLADVIARTMATDPGDRYANASALVEDLRRYLADLSPRGVRDRNLIERWRRWRRRRPHALALLVMGIAVASVAGLALTIARGPGITPIDSEALRVAGRAKRTEEARKLAAAVATLRKQILGSSVWRPNKEADGDLADVTHLIWSERNRFLDSRDGLLPEIVERGIRDDLRELAILSVAIDRRARQFEVVANRRQGLRRLDEARAEVGTSPELERVRDQLLATPDFSALPN